MERCVSAGRRAPVIFVALLAWALALAGHGPVVGVAGAMQDDAALGALGLPPTAGPVFVTTRFELSELTAVHDEDEIFEFSGVLTLEWLDERQAFDPAAFGGPEKVFSGDYQFNEMSPGWFPQLILVNSAGPFETSGVTVRIRPDGSSTLVMAVSGAARVNLDIRRYPFDRQRLDAVFAVLGFGPEEVRLRTAEVEEPIGDLVARVPQWEIDSVTLAPSAASGAGASSVTLSVLVERKSFHVVRLVVIPLVIIVALSFTVFWMDRSSLGDRLAVSFIGILTAVTFQLVIGDLLPKISYFTLIHGFLNLSFLTMCATVVINLAVGALDRRDRRAAGDRLDHHCRWAFPVAYLAILGVMVTVAFTIF
ncbi:MAG: hypothetical protein ACF8QF_09680 [Phycisphaerales bacterium]